MKKLQILIALWFCFIGTISFAQNVGISPSGSAPDASAGLDVNFTDKGLLIPRVSLANTMTASPVTDPATSLLVYNTATVGDVTPGYYFWNGTAWSRLSASLDGTGTANYFPKWTGTSTLGSSQVYDDGTNVGIGTATPGAKLEVVGTLKVTDGTQGADKILTSDADGMASWQNSELNNLASDASNIGCFFPKSTVTTGLSPRSVTVSGNYAYVTTVGALSMAIYNISDPANPALEGSVNTDYNPCSIAVSGNYTYVTNFGSNTMTIYNVIDPTYPTLAGSVITGDYPRSVAVSGNYAYVTNQGSYTMTVYDVSNPANPILTGTVNTGYYPSSVAILGTYAFVANYGSNTMTIYNVSNPAIPILEAEVGTGLHPCSVAVSGDYAFVANDGSNTMTIFNVSNLSNPTLVSSVSTGINPVSVAVAGDYAYLANNGSNTLTIYNVSDPVNPILKAEVGTELYPCSVAVSGNIGYVINMLNNSMQLFQLFCPQSILLQDGNAVLVPETWSTSSVNIYNANPGNVGIGTTTPVAKLDVVGPVKITDGTQGPNKVLTSDANGLSSWQTITLPPAGWSLTGNVGTVPGTNFIGTTDSTDFDIRTANSVKIRFTARGMIEPLNTGNSVFIGIGAGCNDDLTNNQNAFVGTGAGYFNSSGFYNTALGTNALSGNSSGIINTAVGCYALALNSTGDYNTAGGSSALYHNSDGNNNVSTGNNSLWNNSTGSNNTANGNNSLFTNTNGNFNTAIGDSSDVASGSLTNATAIGSKALVASSNSLVLGSIAGVNNATTTVNVGIGTTTPSARLHIVGTVKIADGTQGASKVLTSDADGLASWQTPALPPSGWALTGNAGTVPGTNFIGTTDNQGIDFRTNNILKTRITAKGAIETYNTGKSVFIGEGAGSNDNLADRQNVFIGYMAGNQNTSGIYNTACGFESLKANVSSYLNTAYGAYTLHANSGGTQNTAVGFEALFNNTNGDENTAIGRGAMFSNISGSGNSAFGKYALNACQEGSYNTAMGLNTLVYNTGNNNTAIGHSALIFNYTGELNTAVGGYALMSNNGSLNSALGYSADVGSGELLNATAIGANSLVNSNNSLVLGSINGVNGAAASVNVGIGTTTPLERLDVVGGNIRTTGQFVSTLATGVAPLQVSSNTIVSNLNADLLDGQQATAFASATGSTSYIQNQTASDQAAGFRITGNGIFNGGNVGIGTTSPTGNLQIDNTGDVTLVLKADTDNNAGGEADNSRIELHQDGGGVVGAMGLTGSNDALHLGDIQNAFYIVEEYSEGALQFGTNNQIKMTILPNGYVGIGTNAPKVPLHIATATSSTPFSSTSVSYNRMIYNYLPLLATGGLNTLNTVVSLVAEGDIVCKGTLTIASAIYFSSDKRLKDITGISNSLKDLDILKNIQVTDYTMKDKVTWGFASCKKAIAQQVEEVYPQAVTKTTDYIPDIYEFASKVEKTNTGYIVTMDKSLSCKVGDKIRLELEGKGTVEADVVNMLNENQIEVSTETDISTGQLFVYGLQVDDLRTVDYDAISMLNVSATQELARQLKEAQDRIEELEAQIGEIREYLGMKAER